MKSRAFWATRIALPCLTTILCLPLCLQAQQNKLAVEPPELLTVKRGADAKQSLKAVIVPGFHVNSDKPKSEYLVPLKLTWDSGPLTTKSISYPKPEEMELNGDKIVVFTGKFPIETEFTVPADAPKGSTTLNGKIRFQACNTTMCFAPKTIEIHLPVSIE